MLGNVRRHHDLWHTYTRPRWFENSSGYGTQLLLFWLPCGTRDIFIASWTKRHYINKLTSCSLKPQSK